MSSAAGTGASGTTSQSCSNAPTKFYKINPNHVILLLSKNQNSPNPVILLLAKYQNSPNPVIRDYDYLLGLHTHDISFRIIFVNIEYTWMNHTERGYVLCTIHVKL